MSSASRAIASLFTSQESQPIKLLPSPLHWPRSNCPKKAQQNPVPESVRAERNAERLRHRRAREEAKGLAELIGKKGETLESIRAHIRIDDDLEKCLLKFIALSPGEAQWVKDAIRFRGLVLNAFDELIRAQQYAERIAEAEAEAARRAALIPPVLPLLQEIVVTEYV